MTTQSIDRLFSFALRSSGKRKAGRSDSAWRTACAVFLFCAATALLSPAQTLTTLANLPITSNPYGVLVRGSDGNYYGTTYGDGTTTGGIVFEVTPTGTFTTLHTFAFCSQTPCTDGQNPTAGLIQASDGAFYGTTTYGGTANRGTIFKITTTGTLTTLYSFCASDCTDGAAPYGALVQDAEGNFYGTTNVGGYGDGTVFKFTPPSTLTTLYSFCSAGAACPDGSQPQAGLVQGKDGNFYGTTYAGGNANCANGSTCGTIFNIAPTGSLTTLYSFCPQSGCPDGEQPHAGLIQGTDGNFYGTTYGGGSSNGGTIFKITPTGTLTTLYSFCSQTACTDGQGPWDALVQASDGNYYGTTAIGGANNQGTIFEMSPTGTLTKLWDFCKEANCSDGAQPYAAMVQDVNGIFYGTATDGGTGYGGTVFSYSQLPVTNASPASLNFGNQTVGTTSGQQSTTLTNIGGATLSITSITITGTSSSEFALATNSCSSSLAPGNSCSINVTFTPTATGSASAAISISDNAAGSPQSVSLTGTGVNAVPVAGISPASLNFGNQTVGTTSGQQSTTLTNTGSANLTITSISITGTNSSEFALATNSCSSSLTPGNSCNISVTFTPTASGSASAAISISDNAASSPQSVSLTGTGVTGISFSPASLNFPSQYVGSSGLPQTATLTNTGDTVVTIKNVTASPADFAASNACGSSLAAGASCSIGVSFKPTASGPRNGLLTVTDNLSNSPQTIPLTGTGQDFSLVSSSSSSATVTPGQTATYTLLLSPGGGFDDTVTLACSGAPATSTCSLSSATVTLNGSNSASVTVTVTTAGTSASLAHPGDFLPASRRLALWLALSGLPGLVLMGSGSGGWRGKRRGRLLYGLALLCVFFLVIMWSACGGGSSSANSNGNSSSGGGTAAGTYNLTVTGTCTTGSTTLTHNTKLTLVVQ
jgi:uncharacterized repeat protein (TIGR03803 family)